MPKLLYHPFSALGETCLYMYVIQLCYLIDILLAFDVGPFYILTFCIGTFEVLTLDIGFQILILTLEIFYNFDTEIEILILAFLKC